MSFFQKLKLNIPTEVVSEEQTPPRRKRGRPRKYPLEEAAQKDFSLLKRGPGRPPKAKEVTEPKEEKQAEGELTIDVYETDGELVIQSPVAGVKPENIEITIEDDMLIIRGERPALNPEEREKTIMQECYWGPFSRRFVLPVEVEGGIKASLERGILTIRLPKAKKTRKRKITVEEIGE